MKKRAMLAVMLAGAMALGFSAAGCNKRDDKEQASHTQHTYDYISDGADGHHSVTTCDGHAPIVGETVAHEYDGDTDATCNICGYERQITSDDNNDDDGDNDDNNDDDGDNDGNDGNDGPTDGTDDKDDPADGTDDTDDGADDGKVEEPVIPKPAAGAPEIYKASSGELECAYVEWTAAQDAEWYDVYYRAEGSGQWTALDQMLVREYDGFYRADALGLSAGTYEIQVVPVGSDGKAYEEYAAYAEKMTVLNHDRAGYAFVGGTSSGAYNEDGTLKENANVIYVTNDTKDSVTLTLNGVDYTGVQSILAAQRKIATPLDIRLVGNVGSPAIDGVMNAKANTLLIKETTAGVTIEGVGNDATVNGWTLRVVSVDNVEVRNLGFMNTQASEPDNVTLEKDKHVWVHNCDFFYGGAGGDSDQAKGDGALDTKVSSYITHSYNHFYDSGKCNLQGMKEEAVSNYITYHHNWYDHSDSRHPRIRECTVHVYNNYFDGNAKYGVGVTYGASAFVENNYFRSTATMRPMMTAAQGTDALGDGTFSGENGGVIKAFGNYFDCSPSNLKLITQLNATTVNDIDCYVVFSREEQVPSTVVALQGGTSYSNFDTAADMYEYKVDTAEEAKAKVERYAGRVDGGDFKWTFDNEVEDANYGIITELKTALMQYRGGVVKIGNVEVTDGGVATEPEAPAEPIEGEINFIPTKSGDGFTVSGTTKDNAEMTVGGVVIPKSSALKINSAGKVTFVTSVEMTMTLYLENDKTVSIDGVNKTLTQSSGCYTVTVQLAAGEHVIAKGGGENTLYLIKLIPVS